MSRYKYQTSADLAWKNNREVVTLMCRQVMNKVLNEALHELDEQYCAALNQGQVLDATPDMEQLESLFLRTAQREFGNGSNQN